MSRKIPRDVLNKFNKYTTNNARYLTRPQARVMFHKEFSLNPEESEEIFDMFDTDKNGKMSVWEFQHFYQYVGENASEWVKLFKQLDKDGSGQLDFVEAFHGIETLFTHPDDSIDEQKIASLLKTAGGVNNALDLGAFISLLCRLCVYNPE